MKHIIMLVVMILAQPMWAAKVKDEAHLLSSDETSRLESSLANLPVWVETYHSVHNDNIRSFGDMEVTKIAGSERGFLIVVTVSPRAWRISMNPAGFVGSEATRLIGDQMAFNFKQGHFYDGLSGAAHRLSSLAVPNAQTTVAVEGGRSVTTTVTTKTTKAVVPQRPIDTTSETLLWIFIIIVCLIITICLFGWIMAWIEHRQDEKRAERRREQEAEDNRRDELYARKFAPPPVYHANAQTPPNPTPLRAEDVPATAARVAYERYTPEERRTIINNYPNSPYYGSAMHDPIMFYLLMNSMNHPGYGYGGYVAPHNGAFAPQAPVQEVTETTETRTVREDYTPPSRSSRRDDDSGGSSGSYSSPSSSPSPSYDPPSSSSYDSGGSSGGGFDSGSSSSSGGSDGSW